MELLRIDPAKHFAGLRLNAWVSIFVFVCAWGFFIWWQLIPRSDVPAPAGPSAPEPSAPKGKTGRARKPKKTKKPSVKVKGPRMTVPKGRVRSGR